MDFKLFGILILAFILRVRAFEEEVILSNEIEDGKDLLILTVASSETDGFNRYLRSAKVYNLNGKVLGMGEEWKGGDIKNNPGGGYKVNLLKEELENHKNKDNLVIMFTDSYDVLLLGDKSELLKKFDSFGANVVFGAEDFCWPDEGLKDVYPKVDRGYRFLNSGGFIGYAKDLYGIVNEKPVADLDDDQLYYTKVYLDPELRKKYNIKLDHTAQIFQNLNGAVAEVEMKFRGKEPYLENTIYNTQPLVAHGNGPSKRILNYLGNYLPKSWNTEDQCTSCREDNIIFETLTEIPHIVIALFIEKATPFLEEFLIRVAGLDYPKDKIDLFIHNGQEYHNEDVEDFIQFVSADNIVDKYHSIKTVGPDAKASEWVARNMGLDFCVETKCDYYLSLDGEAHLDNPMTLKQLINQNRNVVAPMLVRPFKAWSNFWGALNNEEYYARGTDYMDIVMNRRKGLWNVPYISAAYLIKGPFIHNEATRPNFVHGTLDADMAFCKNLRENGDFFYITNRVNWGHLVGTDDFSTAHLNNELWEIENNRFDWELRYLHKNYSQSLADDAEIATPCPDVYWFPIISERFADELVEEMENFGKWSDGSNQDSRIDGGYENVPTRDIHMKQIGYEENWLHFLNTYVRPLQEKAFMGYISEPPRSLMNFVVRYRPDEQPFLRPHHDSSTYTINVALNNAGIDYEGGGCRFIRYDCTLKDTKKGWMLMHPGRLTHYHEGLIVTKGTRYIMISFVDP